MPILPVCSYHSSIRSEWAVKIPTILIVGVSTNIDAPRNILSSHALEHLSPCTFVLKSPAERLDAVIEAVFIKHWAGFSIGHTVATFLRNYFLRQDGTLTSFIRAMKVSNQAPLFPPLFGALVILTIVNILSWVNLISLINICWLHAASIVFQIAILQLIFKEPLSFVLKGLVDGEENKVWIALLFLLDFFLNFHQYLCINNFMFLALDVLFVW